MSLQAGVGAGREHPKVAAVRAAVRERLAKQEADEASSKDALVQKAASYLETFYQARAPAWLCAACPWTRALLELFFGYRSKLELPGDLLPGAHPGWAVRGVPHGPGHCWGSGRYGPSWNIAARAINAVGAC